MPERLDTAELCARLVAIPSPTGAEQRVLQALEAEADRLALPWRRLPVDIDRHDLLIGAPAPRVLLSTHVDTVPGGPPLRRLADRIEGRGSCDAKGIAAAMLGALIDLRDAGHSGVALLLLVGEETSSDGARAAAAALDPVAYIVNGEPTELRFVAAQRGALAFTLTARGRSCHSGYPELGHSATHALLDALQRLRDEPWPEDPEIGPTLVNVGTLAGGSAANVLAADASAAVMMRVVTPAAEVEARVRALVGPAIELAVRTRSDPQQLEVPAGRPSCVVGFASDVAHLRPLGTPLMVGPGSIHVAHTDQEHLLLADLQQARQLYAELCVELLGRQETR